MAKAKNQRKKQDKNQKKPQLNYSQRHCEKALIKTLTILCEEFKYVHHGFSWLTHTGDAQAQRSLAIICVFDDEQTLNRAKKLKHTEQMAEALTNAVQQLQKQLGVERSEKIRVSFDSEEACNIQHQGDWQARLTRH